MTDTQTITPLPAAGENFFTQLQTFLRQEAAERIDAIATAIYSKVCGPRDSSEEKEPQQSGLIGDLGALNRRLAEIQSVLESVTSQV